MSKSMTNLLASMMGLMAAMGGKYSLDSLEEANATVKFVPDDLEGQDLEDFETLQKVIEIKEDECKNFKVKYHEILKEAKLAGDRLGEKYYAFYISDDLQTGIFVNKQKYEEARKNRESEDDTL